MSRAGPRRLAAGLRTGLLAAALGVGVAAEAGAAASPAVRFRPDAQKLAEAPRELQGRLREDPFVYFRYLNTSWAAAVCEGFREDLPGLPTAVLHGDAHVEQYALTATDRGLDDFDDACRGPAVIDIARFLGSLELTLRQHGWLKDVDRVFDAFFEAYRHSLRDPSYLPPEPAVVKRLRATHTRTRDQFLQWGDSLMTEATEREHAQALRSLTLVDAFVRELRPELPAGYFQLKRWGWLHMGVGSLLVRKALLRIEGPSAAAGDDELIEAKQVSPLEGVACVQVPLSGEAFRVIEAAEQIGRIRHNVLVVAPRREDQRPGLRDWWLSSWDESYVELTTADLETADDVAEVARDVGAQLGSAGLRHSMPALEAQLRQVEIHAVRRLEPRIRASSRQLVAQLLGELGYVAEGSLMKTGAMLLLCVVGFAAGRLARAEEPDPPPTAQAPDAVAEPTKDIFDVLRELFHKPPPPAPGPQDYKNLMVAAAPVLTYGPTSGFGIGVAGNLAVYKGYPATTRISSLVASVTGTTKEQVLISAKLNMSARENRWRLEGDNRLHWTSQKTFGLGTGTAEDAAVDQKYDFFRFYETVYRRVGGNLYAGGGFLFSNHTDVHPADDDATAAWPESPYVAYSELHGFDPAAQRSAGFSVNALLDSRDGPISPSHGWYANATYRMFFEGFLGGSSGWQQFSYDTRTYFRLSRDARHRLAFWLSGDFVTGGTAPYLDLPATGSDTYGRAGRGYPQGRFRGEQLVYGEAEYRWTITGNGLLGMVAFLNTETLSDKHSGEKLFDTFATGAGFGLRVMLNKRSQTNLCFDVGFGRDGSHAVYFAVQEAF